eukprot:314815-Lingulodinium_polyedra.AAC.1
MGLLGDCRRRQPVNLRASPLGFGQTKRNAANRCRPPGRTLGAPANGGGGTVGVQTRVATR